MAAFHSCLEIFCRPESPEVSLCSLSRAALSSPSPALAPGTSLPVRRGGRHGGGVAAVCGPGVPVGWLGRFRCPRPASFASTQRAAAPGNKSNGFLQPFPKKRNSRESAQDRCRRCRKSGAWLLSVRRRCCGCPPGSACSSVRCRCHRSGACLLCVRWRCRGLPPVPVLSLCCPPSSPAALLAVVVVSACAVSVCCPVLPEAVVGASRATRGRLASTQGCHRCSCPSRWARPLALRTVAVAAFPARSASTQEQGQRPRQQKQRVSTTLSKKKRNSRESAQDRCFSCRKSGACPPRHGVGASPSAPALLPCVGAVGGRRCRSGAWLFLRVARSAWSGRGGVARNQGEVGQHTGLPPVLLPVSLGAATGITRVVAVAAFACPPAHRDSTGRGNTSNGPPQPCPRKKKHRSEE